MITATPDRNDDSKGPRFGDDQHFVSVPEDHWTHGHQAMVRTRPVFDRHDVRFDAAALDNARAAALYPVPQLVERDRELGLLELTTDGDNTTARGLFYGSHGYQVGVVTVTGDADDARLAWVWEFGKPQVSPAF